MAQSEREHLHSLIKDFDSAMLVTMAEDGSLRSRPMAIAGCEPAGPLYFVTNVDSPKVHELEHDDRVNVSLQGKTQFASISGTARVVQDRALVASMWKEQWKVWFPKGKDDPGLCMIAVEPHEAEYWDNAGTKGVRYLFDAVRAFVKGTTPQPNGPDQHAKVHL